MNHLKTMALIVAVGSICIIVNYASQHLALVTTPSISPKILWKVDAPSKNGDYVLFRWIYPPELNNERWLAKVLLCNEGDMLSESEGRFYCNQKKITEIPAVFKNKYRSKLQGFNGKISNGKAFVGSEHSAGFDSRYFGLVERGRLTKAIVIF